MKKEITYIGILLITILLAGCVSIPIGGGSSIKLSTGGVTITSSEGKETVIDGNQDSENISIIQTDAEGNENNFSVTADGEIPDEFPKEIPIPKEAKITSSSIQNDSEIEYQQLLLLIEEKKDMSEYIKIYKEFLDESGYEIEQEMKVNGEQKHYIALRSDESLTILVTTSEGNITIMFHYSKTLGV